MKKEKHIAEYDRVELIKQLKALKDAKLGQGETQDKINQVFGEVIEHAVWDDELKLDQMIRELESALKDKKEGDDQ